MRRPTSPILHTLSNALVLAILVFVGFCFWITTP